MPREHEFGPPSNDNLDPDDAWKRAQLLLEAYARIAQTQHLYDNPAQAVRGLLTDIAQYCAARSAGQAKDSPEHLDFDKLVSQAKADLTTMRDKEETQNLAARREVNEPRPELDRRAREAARAAELRAEIEADERAKQREIDQGLRRD